MWAESPDVPASVKFTKLPEVLPTYSTKLDPIDNKKNNNLAIPPELGAEQQDNGYIIENWIIENIRRIWGLSNRIVALRLMVESKRNNLSEQEKERMVQKTKEVLVSQNRKITAENISEVAMLLMEERGKTLDGAINRLIPLVDELTDIKDMPKNPDGTRGFFDLDALKNMQRRIEQVEKTLHWLSEEIRNC